MPIGRDVRSSAVRPSVRPSVSQSVSQSVSHSVSQSDFVTAITFNTIKGMWMKPGMWQYVEYARILWWVAVRRTSSCVVRRQCFECGHSRKPD